MLMVPDTRSIVLSGRVRARERENHFVSNKHPVDLFRSENRHPTRIPLQESFSKVGLRSNCDRHVYGTGRLNPLSEGIYPENEAEVERLREVRFRRSAIRSQFRKADNICSTGGRKIISK